MHNLDTSPGSENYEQRDAHLKLILATGVVLVLITLICYGIGYMIIRTQFEPRNAATEFQASPIEQERKEIWKPGVRLQADPPSELQLVQSEFNSAITKWDNSEAPVFYRIPVDVAMDLVAEHGLPTINALPPADEVPPADAAAPSAEAPSAHETPGE